MMLTIRRWKEEQRHDRERSWRRGEAIAPRECDDFAVARASTSRTGITALPAAQDQHVFTILKQHGRSQKEEVSCNGC